MTPRGQQASGGSTGRSSANDDGVHGSWKVHDATVYRERIGRAIDAGMMSPMKTASTVALTVAIVGLAAGMSAQQAGFKRTVLQQADISAPGHEVITAVGEFQPGASPGRHTHPGEEVSYVLEGSVVLEIAGKPDKTVRAGEAFIIPAGAVHNATNKGTAVAKIVATYIVEKGKPLATPAPAK